jgi:hypothetical protein
MRRGEIVRCFKLPCITVQYYRSRRSLVLSPLRPLSRLSPIRLDSTVRSPRTPHVGTYWRGRTIRHLSRTLLHTGLRTCHPIDAASRRTLLVLLLGVASPGISVRITSFLFRHLPCWYNNLFFLSRRNVISLCLGVIIVLIL